MNQIKLSENVMVSDPCYTPDTWCQAKLDDVLPGVYNVDVQKSDEGDWGVRVASITVIHEDYQDGDFDWDDIQATIGVDSGQCGIFCMTGYRNDELSESITTPTLQRPFVLPFSDEGDKWYNKMCQFTLSEEQWGLYDTGVVSSSGIGDGSYPLEVMTNGDDKIVGLKITYLGNSDWDILNEDEEQTTCDRCGGECDWGSELCDECETQQNQED